MTSVEDEIVSMKFDNTQFEKAVSTSIGTLDKLKKALVIPANTAGNGIAEISKGMRGFHMNPLVDAASEVGRAFSTMSVVAISAIATIASQATQAGLGIAKSLTISPITQGFSEYETQIGSVQTILANTGLEGEKGLAKVTSALDELNEFSDKTIYNFTQMAKNIGTFTAAGVDLDVSTAAIKGIANLAAVSGSTAEQASTAMYQLSQALASGTVKLMDWNSVVNAGMGGQVFKDALMETARVHGVAIDDMIKKDGSFRETLQEGWLTSNVLTETLAKFTGDLSAEQLKSQGYTEKQVKEILKLGVMANDAATKVKTLSQLMSTLKEAVGSGWSQTWKLIFGDFNEAKSSFTSASDVLGGFIKSSADARNKVLADWAALGGRTKLISAISNAFKALMSVLGPIKDAFREIFPAATGMQLKNLTKSLNQFFRAIRLSAEAQEDLKNTFAGLFAVMHIAFTIIKGVAHVLGTLVGLFFKSQGSTLAFTGGIGQMLVALDAFLTKGKFVENFFNLLADALTALLGPLVDVKNLLVGGIVDLATGDPSAFFDAITDSIVILLGMVDSLTQAFADMVNALSDGLGGFGHIQGLDLAGMFGGASADKAKGSVDGIKDSLSGVAKIGEEIRNVWNSVLGVFKSIGDFLSPLTSQLGTVFAEIKEQFNAMFSGQDISFDDVLGAIQTGLFLSIFLQIRSFVKSMNNVSTAASGVLKQVTSNLKSMQAQVRAQVLLQIAVALVLLAGAIFLLSKTDPKHLAAALGAVTIMLIELVAALKLLEKNIGKGEGVKLMAIAAAMLLMSVAIAALAGAVFLFSLMDMGDMQRGLLGVTEAMAVMTAAAALMSKSGAGANMIGAATGLLIMSAALVAMAGAIKLYSKIDQDTLTEGLVKIAATLAVLALSMNLMKTGVSGAAATFIVAAALVVLAHAIESMGNIDQAAFEQGMVGMALSLALIAGALALMTGALPGAAALFIVAAALTVLGPAIAVFGQMDTGTIVKGLAVIAGALLVLAGVSYLIAPMVPVLVALAAAFGLIGLAIFGIGAGVALFAIGLATLAHNGSAGFDVFLAIIHRFLEELPLMIAGFGDTIDAIAKLIGDKAPDLVEAFAKIWISLIDAGIKVLPKIGQFITLLLKTMLRVIRTYYGDMVLAGYDLIIQLLHGLTQKVPLIVAEATNLIIAFIKALGKNAVRLANAAADVLIDFLNGLADAIESHTTQLNNAGGRVAVAIIAGITAPLRLAGQQVLDAINTAWNWAKDHFNPHLEVKGITIIPRQSEALTGSFAELIGGSEEVTSALEKIKAQIKGTLESAGSDVDKWQNKLEELRKAKVKDPKAIKNAKEKLDEASQLLADAEKANTAYVKFMKAHGDKLKALAKDYDATLARIETARDDLKKAEDAVTSFKASVMATFGTLPDIQAGQSLNSYMRELEKQKLKIIKFRQTLAALQGAGLDNAQIQQFLAEGVDAQHMMDQLLAGGPEAITAFENASAGMTSAATELANMASSMLGLDQGVVNAQNFLDGLITGLADPTSIANLENQMAAIARIMMKAIRKELQVRSPSRKAMEIAKFFVKGLTNQMDAMHRDVESSSAALGEVALDALQTTLAKVGDGVNNELKLSPTITPILDLSQLSRDASAINGLLGTSAFQASMSLAYARDISASRLGTEASTEGTTGDTYIIEKLIEQNNTSPKSLDDVYIYRSTRNILSLAKEALDV